MNPPNANNPHTVAVFANPFSGARPNRDIIQNLCEALKDRNLTPLQIWSPTELQHAIEAGQLNPQHCRALIAAGGDGTLSVAVNAQPPVPIALYPLGTENLFAKHFGFTRSAPFIADAIARNKTKTIDLASVGDHRFTCVASAGYDADVVHRLAAWRHEHPTETRRITRSSYLSFIFKSIAHYRFTPIVLEADGNQYTGSLAMVFNVPRYGLGFDPCPDGSPTDGLMDFVIYGHGGVINSTKYAIATYLRRHTHLPSVHTGKAKHITIRSADGSLVPFEIDGDEAGHTPRTLTSLPNALTIIDTQS